MESNGQPHKIQVSEATAKILHKQGRGKWLQAREDKIQAKGKGELQTYWIVVESMTNSVLAPEDEGN